MVAHSDVIRSKCNLRGFGYRHQSRRYLLSISQTCCQKSSKRPHSAILLQCYSYVEFLFVRTTESEQFKTLLDRKTYALEVSQNFRGLHILRESWILNSAVREMNVQAHKVHPRRVVVIRQVWERWRDQLSGDHHFIRDLLTEYQKTNSFAHQLASLDACLFCLRQLYRYG